MRCRRDAAFDLIKLIKVFTAKYYKYFLLEFQTVFEC